MKYKTGVAVMLAGFLFCSIQVVAQNEPKPETDSSILMRHIRETRIEFAMEEFSDHSFNSGLTEEEIDSLLWLNRIRVSGGRVIYSPDSAFRIFIVNCESCGGYCNPFWRSWLHFNDGSGYVLNNPGFDDVDTVYRMPDGKYLVIESALFRTATDFTTSFSAKLFSLTDYKLQWIPFPQTPSGKTVKNEPSGSFTTHQEYSSEKYKHFVQYDSVSGRLNYQHVIYLDPQQRIDYDYAYVYSGYYQYTNGSFIHKNEDRFILAD